MAQGYSVVNPADPAAAAAYTLDNSGNVVESGSLTVAGILRLAQASTTPVAPYSATTLFGSAGGGLAVADQAAGTASTWTATKLTVGSVVAAGVPVGPGNESYPITSSLAQTVPLWSVTAAQQYTSGVLAIASVYLPVGTSVGHIGFVNGATAAGTPTHWWACLLDSGFILRATSADQLTAAMAANTWFSLAMGTAYTTTYSGRYYLGLMTTATTMPSIGAAPAPLVAVITGTGAPTPLLAGSSTTGLTTAGTAGSTTYLAPQGTQPIPFLYAAA